MSNRMSSIPLPLLPPCPSDLGFLSTEQDYAIRFHVCLCNLFACSLCPSSVPPPPPTNVAAIYGPFTHRTAFKHLFSSPSAMSQRYLDPKKTCSLAEMMSLVTSYQIRTAYINRAALHGPISNGLKRGSNVQERPFCTST